MLYKELWSERNRFDDCSATVTVLLSSEATVRIAVTNVTPLTESGPEAPGERESQSIRVTDADIALSTQLRPDLRVFTRKWAVWLLSRVARDSNGAFFLQLHDAPALEQCYADASVSLDGCHLCVEMHLVGDTSLLVSVTDAASGATSKVFLNERELQALAVALGRVPGGADASSVDVASLVRDQAFLAQVVTKSSVVRLGRKSGEVRPSTLIDAMHRSSTDGVHESADVRLEHAAEVSDDGAREDALASDLRSLLHANSSLAAVAFLARAHATEVMATALRRLQQHEAVRLHAQSYVLRHAASATSAAFSDFINATVEAAKLAKLTELAIASIVDDLVHELIAFECRVELYDAKHSGKFDDHYASKVQATYRMSTQRKQYAQQRFIRSRAVRLLQALQRGISARRRYAELKAEREKYLFYGFRASLHGATTASVPGGAITDPKTRAQALADATERKRLTFLLQVLDGYAAEHDLSEPYRIPAALIETLVNEFGVVVGCPAAFGATVIAFLHASDSDRRSSDGADASSRQMSAASEQPLRLYSSRQIHAALVLALRSLYDDTFGLSATTRRLVTSESRSIRRLNDMSSTHGAADDDVPPRWLLKLSAPFQRANRTRVAALRLARKTAGRKASHLVARDYQRLLASEAFSSFESCREAWEASIRARRAEQRALDASSREDVAQRVLDLVISSIKDWGVDPEPLFAGLNVCVRHRQGKDIVAVVEAKFDAFADGVNKLHGKRSIASLRDEIEQELEDFEKLVALRCLNIGRDHVVTVPPSEILHIMLRGRVDDEYVRHALPTVLPIASLADKYALVRTMVRAYANAAYGDAINAICYSCLDVAEHVTVEAAQLLDRITRVDPALDTAETSAAPSCVASRALHLLTGAPALAFVQFLAKVAQFNRTTQHRTLALLAPYAEHCTLFRIASAVARLDDYDTTAQLYDAAFQPDVVYACARLWTQYEELYGADAAKCARASGPGGLASVAPTGPSDVERRRSIAR